MLIGPLGYYGLSRDKNYNLKVNKANLLVDEYNRNISLYANSTIESQLKYQKSMIKKINKLLL